MATQAFPLSLSSLAYARDQLKNNQNSPQPALMPNVPSQINGPTAWSGSDTDLPLHILELNDQDVLVVEAALQYFKGKSSYAYLTSC